MNITRATSRSDSRRTGAIDPASALIVKYAKDIASELRGQMVRVSADFGNNPIKAKRR